MRIMCHVLCTACLDQTVHILGVNVNVFSPGLRRLASSRQLHKEVLWASTVFAEAGSSLSPAPRKHVHVSNFSGQSKYLN